MPYVLKEVYSWMFKGFILSLDRYGYHWAHDTHAAEVFDPTLYDEDAFVERYKLI
jgi:hypothetical protein